MTIFNSIAKHFPTKTSLSKILKIEREKVVNAQGWRRGIFKTSLGSISRGVFRHIRCNLYEILKKAGGINMVVPFQPEYNDAGERVYSCAMDSGAVEKDWIEAKKRSEVPI